jgi:hypothetical protein
MRTECGVEGGGADALVFREQVVGELVEIRDPPDHRGSRNELVAVGRELGQEWRVFGVALDEVVARVAVKAAFERPVLGVVVDADDLVAGVEQVGDEVAGNEPSCAGD